MRILVLLTTIFVLCSFCKERQNKSKEIIESFITSLKSDKSNKAIVEKYFVDTYVQAMEKDDQFDSLAVSMVDELKRKYNNVNWNYDVFTPKERPELFESLKFEQEDLVVGTFVEGERINYFLLEGDKINTLTTVKKGTSSYFMKF